ncbi:DgyrCDS7369 [Dimorphilus gyrociliatus]|uniref:non-specific serine/threonine protein kinase n=1 Tax=Dimorphilus gyrociliatus TaxID=2664684 RepID=A0A7I8VR04_9ANNE|nr:DgyrCDS7369 [Dimorphilus gyrociliatus]
MVGDNSYRKSMGQLYSNDDEKVTKSPTTSRSSSVTSREFRGRSRMEGSSSRHNSSYSSEPKYYSEDTRIVKLLKRVTNEKIEKERRLISLKILHEFVNNYNENKKIVISNAFDIAEAMFDIKRESRFFIDNLDTISSIVASTANVMQYEGHKLLSWIHQKLEESKLNNERSFCLNIIQEILERDKKMRFMQPLMKDMMKTILKILLDADEDKMFQSITEIIVILSIQYPEVVNPYFSDICDVLIGWNIDATNNEKMQIYTRNICLKLSPFFCTRIDKAVDFMLLFVEDIRTYVQDMKDINEKDDTSESREDLVEKSLALLRMFSVFAECLEENLENRNEFAKASNNCLKHLVQYSSDEIDVIEENLLSYVKTQCCIEPECLPQFYSFLQLAIQIIKRAGTKLPLEFIHFFVGADSVISSYRQFNDNNSQELISEVYKSLLRIKNVQILTKSYTLFLCDMEKCLNVIADYDDLPHFRLLDENIDNPFKDKEYSIVQAESYATFYSVALSSLATMKNNLLTFALNPSLFQLFSNRLRLWDKTFIQFYPEVTATAFQTFFSYCSTHEHFISSSSLNTGTSTSHFGGETTEFFERLLKFLTKILKCSGICYEIRRICLKWTKDILKYLVYTPNLIKNELFVKLLTCLCDIAMSDSCNIIVNETCQTLKECFEHQVSFPMSFLNNCFDVCMVKLSSVNSDIRQNFLLLLKVLPLDTYITRSYDMKKCEYSPILNELWNARRNIMINNSMASFDQHAFKGFMNYILRGEKDLINNGSWMQRIFDSAIAQQDVPDTIAPKYSLDISKYDSISIFMWFWATWQCANHCLSGKLRTPLGKANETILSIENVIVDFAKELQLNGKSLSSEENSNHSFKPSDDLHDHIRVHLLLQFIEHLEKLLYNAYEGTAIAIAAPNKTIRNFFRTNRQVCDDWLNRIRLHVMHISIAIKRYSLAVRHGFVLLSQFEINEKYKTKEFEETVILTAFSLCKLKSPQMIQGLNVWCRKVARKKYFWLKPFAECASGRLQDSAYSFQIVLDNYIQVNNPDKPNRNTLESDSGNSDDGAKEEEKKDFNMDVNPNLIHYLVNLTADIYCELGSWQELDNWCDKIKDYQENYIDADSIFSAFKLDVDLDSVRALASFEKGEFSTSVQHAKKSSNFDTGVILSSWNSKQISYSATFQHVIASIVNDKADSLNHAHLCELWCQRLLDTDMLDWPLKVDSLTLQHLHFINSYGKEKEKDGTLSITDHLQQNAEKSRFDMILMPLWFLKQTGDLRDSKTAATLSNLMQVGARLARKQHCTTLSQELLVDYIHNVLPDHVAHDVDYSYDSMINKLRNSYPLVNRKTYLVIEREAAKLKYDGISGSEAVSNLSCALLKVIEEPDCHELVARSLLTIVKWTDTLRMSEELGNDEAIEDKLESLIQIEGLSKNDDVIPQLNKKALIDNRDILPGSLLRLACLKAPKLGKTWINFATWCLKQGRRLNEFVSEGKVQLTSEECDKIKKLLPKGIKDEDTEKIFEIMSYVQTARFVNEEDISEQYISLHEDPRELTRRQLLNSSCVLQTAADSVLDRLIETWSEIKDRVYHPYLLAVHAYGSFLQLNSNDSEAITTTTLRLLRLLVKHVSELKEALEPVLENTPASSWLSIIPQLFSRLNHPDPTIRQIVSNLISRVAEEVPHLIVYPAVVGHTAASVQRLHNQKGLVDKYLSQNEAEEGDADVEDDLLAEDRVNTLLQHCFGAIVNTLSAKDAKMVSEVEAFVYELRRITLLWDELWNGTLTQYQNDMDRRFKQLENEIKSVYNNNDLTDSMKNIIAREKHQAILKPTIFILENLYELTSRKPETPHEQWFCDTYLEEIQQALRTLKDPPDVSWPSSSWKPFKDIQKKMNERAQKRSSLLLQMNKMSPHLAKLKNTSIPLPGCSPHQKPLSISSIENTVQILPTKTKPKKLYFVGEDGKKCAFLFKGLEDLHLDERIMQLISIVNNMFAKLNRSGKSLHARHYSVTPLGARSGLIEWVQAGTPLFSLYKRWQQRELTACAIKNNQPLPTHIPRPSDVFYAKLKSVFERNKLDPKLDRKDWPKEAKKAILSELIKETPSDLLSKELWCTSTSTDEWLHVVKTFNNSIALMSVIGYVIGLGDRHLDNILVDLNTGEVIQIDYNVCFEKGKNLRVPENVPFRMTHNIESALGVTGVEGLFRSSSEMVLRILRRGKETLLTLLEAFLYDPLIDWTVGHDTGYQGALYGGTQKIHGATEARRRKHKTDRFVAVSMLTIRLKENKLSWFRNKETMAGHVSNIVEKVKMLEETYNNMLKQKEAEDIISQLIKYLTDASADPGHPFHSLPIRYEQNKEEQHLKESVTAEIQMKYIDIDNFRSAYERTLLVLKGKSYEDLQKQFGLTPAVNSSYSCVEEFLINAGQTQLLNQGQGVENQVRDSQMKKNNIIEKCLGYLINYVSCIPPFTNALIEENPYLSWTKWFKIILDSFTVESCEKVFEYIKLQYLKDVRRNEMTQHILSTEAKLAISLNTMMDILDKYTRRRESEKLSKIVLETHEQDLLSAMFALINERLDGNRTLFLSIIITHLNSTVKKFKLIESNIFGAKERAVSLLTNDGDWFMDEHFNVADLAYKYISLMNVLHPQLRLKNSLLEETSLTFNAIHSVLNALQEMSHFFANIILPETIKCLRADDLSLKSSLKELSEIVRVLGDPIDRVIIDLKTHINHVILGQRTSEDLLRRVKRANDQFLKLITSTSENLTNGQMIFVGFHGLFERVFIEWQNFTERSSKMRIPHEWYWVDIAFDVKTLQLNPVTDLTCQPLRLLWFVEEIHAMVTFFERATEANNAYTGKVDSVLSNELQLEQPIRQFIAKFTQQQMLGYSTEMLSHHICACVSALGFDVKAVLRTNDIGATNRMALDAIVQRFMEVKTNSSSTATISSITNLMMQMGSNWMKQHFVNRLDKNIIRIKEVIERTKCHITAVHWQNPKLFQSYARQVSHILMSLQVELTNISTHQANLNNLCENWHQIDYSIIQRLKWACGANANLQTTLNFFNDAILKRNELLKNSDEISQYVIQLCNSIIQMERIRNGGDDIIAEQKNNMDLLNKAKDTCQNKGNLPSLTPLESHLMKLLNMEDIPPNFEEVVRHYLYNAKEKFSESDVEDALVQVENDLKMECDKIKPILKSFHHLTSCINNSLKAVSKFENLSTGRKAKTYLERYKKFSEDFTSLLKILTNENPGEHLSLINCLAPNIQEVLSEVYDDLYKLELDLPVPEDALQVESKETEFSEKIQLDPKTGKTTQERNSYATSVWSRVKQKLDGKDPDINYKMSTTEQIDYIIMEATRIDNLSELYEGWTPWV